MILIMKEFGNSLTTRDIGEKIRVAITNSIKNNEVITVDFTDVNQITHSCADEIFGKLAEEIGINGLKKNISIKNTNETTSTIIKYVIARRLSDSK